MDFERKMGRDLLVDDRAMRASPFVVEGSTAVSADEFGTFMMKAPPQYEDGIQ